MHKNSQRESYLKVRKGKININVSPDCRKNRTTNVVSISHQNEAQPSISILWN